MEGWACVRPPQACSCANLPSCPGSVASPPPLQTIYYLHRLLNHIVLPTLLTILYLLFRIIVVNKLPMCTFSSIKMQGFVAGHTHMCI